MNSLLILYLTHSLAALAGFIVHALFLRDR